MQKNFAFIALLALFCVSCKAASPIPGLQLYDAAGRLVEIYAPEPESAKVLSETGRTSCLYSFASAVSISDTLDIILDIDADGSFLLTIYESASDKIPAASFVVDIRASALLHLPGKRTIGAFEIVLKDAKSLVLNAISMDARLSGMRFIPADNPRLHLSADTSLGYDRNNFITAVALPPLRPLAGSRHASVLAQARQSGKISFRSGSSAWDVSSLDALPAALPLELFDRVGQLSSGLQVSASGGLSQAYYNFGNGAPPADLHALLSCSAPSGDFSLWSWDIFRDTLVFDFKDYATQDLYLKRLAFFAEKPGFVGRLAGDSEIATLHGWNAHDYPASTLLAFYSLAKKTGFALNRQEQALYALLLRYSILAEDADGNPSLGSGAIISVSQESDKNLRRVFIDHESSHALFFHDEQYRKLSAQLWDSQSAEIRSFWKLHFEYRRYDPSNRYLMVNELQAYLSQQSTGRVDAYYRDNVIPRLAAAYPSRALWLAANTESICLDALAQAKKLDAYLLKTWGLRAGAFGRASLK